MKTEESEHAVCAGPIGSLQGHPVEFGSGEAGQGSALGSPVGSVRGHPLRFDSGSEIGSEMGSSANSPLGSGANSPTSGNTPRGGAAAAGAAAAGAAAGAAAAGFAASRPREPEGHAIAVSFAACCLSTHSPSSVMPVLFTCFPSA